MYYKIGQIAKMMGVSTHLLKHYEKFNLIQPIKNEKSNYRYYDLSQVAKIIDCKKYRNMGFSLQDIKELGEANAQTISERLELRIQAIEEEISQLEYMKCLALEYRKECETAEENLNEWYIEPMPESYFLTQSENEFIVETNSCQDHSINLIDGIPICKSMLYLRKEEKVSYSWGLWLSQKDLKVLQSLGEMQEFCITERYEELPKQKGFVTYLKLPVPYLSSGILLEHAQEIYNQYKKEEIRQLYAIVVKTSVEDGVEYQYMKMIIPI